MNSGRASNCCKQASSSGYSAINSIREQRESEDARRVGDLQSFICMNTDYQNRAIQSRDNYHAKVLEEAAIKLAMLQASEVAETRKAATEGS